MNTPLARALAALAVVLASCTLRADDWSPNLTLTTAWHDNVTNADRDADKIGALQVNGDVIGSQRYAMGRDDSAHLAFHTAVDWWPRYQLLLSGQVGARAEWQHKFGLGALAPVLSLELAGDYVAAKETGRRGTATGVTVGLRKRFNDLWRATLTQEYRQLDARYAVYDCVQAQTTLEIARDLTPVSRLTLAGYYRSGDIVSYATPPRPDLVPFAPDRLTVDTFRHPLVAYSIEGRTTGAKLSYIHALDDTSAVIVGYEARRTDHESLRYENQVLSLALVHQF